MSTQNSNGGRSAYLIILSIITVVCIVVGAFWHFGGWFGRNTGNFRWLGNFAYAGEVKGIETALDSFDNIDVNIGIGRVEIKEGTEFGIEYSYPEKWLPNVEVKNGKLVVKHPKGLNFNTVGNQNGTCYVIITFPKGTVFDEVNVDDSLGDIDVKDIECSVIDINESLGSVKLSESKAETVKADNSLGDIRIWDVEADKLDANLSMGDLDVKNCDIDEVNCDNSMGSVGFEGSCRYLDINNNMGDIKVETDSDWSGKLETDMGDVKVNGENQGTKCTR